MELDGKSISFGSWLRDGADWLLALNPVYAAAPDLLKQVKKDAGIAHFSYCTPPGKDHAPECLAYRNLVEKATVRA